MDDAPLLSERSDAVLRLVLNRPGTKNSLDPELVDALGEALETAANDASLRVIVLGGAGGAFCSGVDLRSAAADIGSDARLERRIDGFHRLITAIARANQPVIAEIDGPAVGFGADLALACDVRIASTRAYFQEKFVALGLMPDGGGTFHLPRLVGAARAMELLLLGTRIEATEALALGIVSRVVAPEALGVEVGGVATQLAASAPLAVAAIKRAVRANLSATLDEALAHERAGQLELLRSADVREGVAAFFARRAPKFQGK